MNPQTPNQDDQAPSTNPLETPNTPTTQEMPTTTPEADAAAFQAIEALEAEESSDEEHGETATPEVNEKVTVTPTPPVVPSTPAPAPAPIPTHAQTSSPNPFSTFGGTDTADETAGSFTASPSSQSSTEASPPLGAAMTSSLKETAAPVPSSDSFGPKKQSKKRLIIFAAILVLVLAAGSVAGYVVWQSSTPAPTSDTTETQQGDQPGNVDETEADPTPESLEAEASSLEQEINSFDTSELNDTTLNDAALYQN